MNKGLKVYCKQTKRNECRFYRKRSQRLNKKCNRLFINNLSNI